MLSPATSLQRYVQPPPLLLPTISASFNRTFLCYLATSSSPSAHPLPFSSQYAVSSRRQVLILSCYIFVESKKNGANLHLLNLLNK